MFIWNHPRYVFWQFGWKKPQISDIQIRPEDTRRVKAVLCFSRERVRCVLDRTSARSSAACWRPSAATATCSSSTSSRWPTQSYDILCNYGDCWPLTRCKFSVLYSLNLAEKRWLWAGYRALWGEGSLEAVRVEFSQEKWASRTWTPVSWVKFLCFLLN